MKAVRIHQFGGPEVLTYEDVPDPVPGKGEVLIRIAAASINPVDLWQRAGTTNAPLRIGLPAIISWASPEQLLALVRKCASLPWEITCLPGPSILTRSCVPLRPASSRESLMA